MVSNTSQIINQYLYNVPYILGTGDAGNFLFSGKGIQYTCMCAGGKWSEKALLRADIQAVPYVTGWGVGILETLPSLGTSPASFSFSSSCAASSFSVSLLPPDSSFVYEHHNLQGMLPRCFHSLT